MKSQFIIYLSTSLNGLLSLTKQTADLIKSANKPKLALVLLLSLLAAELVQPSRSQAFTLTGRLLYDPFGPFPFLVGEPSNLIQVIKLDGSFERANENTLMLRATPMSGSMGYINVDYLKPNITGVSFDWMLIDDNPGGEGPDFTIQAGYRTDFVNYDLYNGSTTLPHSGSVSLENLYLQSFGFYTNVTDGSSKLEITNLNFTVIPEPASYALILSFFALFLVAVKRRPSK